MLIRMIRQIKKDNLLIDLECEKEKFEHLADITRCRIQTIQEAELADFNPKENDDECFSYIGKKRYGNTLDIK